MSRVSDFQVNFGVSDRSGTGVIEPFFQYLSAFFNISPYISRLFFVNGNNGVAIASKSDVTSQLSNNGNCFSDNFSILSPADYI